MEETEKTEKKVNGGSRPGAGRKAGGKNRKTIKREIAQMYLVRRVEEEIESLTSALLDKAKEKDVPALKEAFDRAWGKSKEKSDITIRIPSPIYGGESIKTLPKYNSDQKDIPTPQED